MRRGRVFLLCVLLCSLVAGLRPAAHADAAGVWLPAGALAQNRYAHTASLLPNGEVLVAGGARSEEVFASTERYDPATNRWRAAAPLATGRAGHTATTLPDGRVLVIGGSAKVGGALASAELYDPAADRWTAAPPMTRPRTLHTATLLRDGRVLVVGGLQGNTADALADDTAEFYDPRANIWSQAGMMGGRYALHSATLLDNGEVLIVGGRPDNDILNASRRAARYDPATNAWRAAANMATLRSENVAALLADGRVLVVGDIKGTGAHVAERYDPAQDRWETLSSPIQSIWATTATRLPNGQILITGGFDYDHRGSQGLAMLFDPATGGWAPLPEMRVFRGHQTATALADGRVLIAGGGSVDATAELYVDASATELCFPDTNKCLRGRFLAYWLAHGGLAINGYPLSDERMETLEDGQPYLVQYLERVRLEAHPESPDPRYQVQLGQFGRAIHPADPPVAARPGATYFEKTGHNVSGDFLAYWQEHGGTDQFGLPLTEVIRETLEDKEEHEVQYFERARFERHPKNRPPFDVLLGQFGRRIMEQRLGQP